MIRQQAKQAGKQAGRQADKQLKQQGRPRVRTRALRGTARRDATRRGAARRARPRCRPRSPWPTDLYYTRGTGPAYTSLDPQAILGRAKSERTTPRPHVGTCFALPIYPLVSASSCVSETCLRPSSGLRGRLRETCFLLRACVRACVREKESRRGSDGR